MSRLQKLPPNRLLLQFTSIWFFDAYKGPFLALMHSFIPNFMRPFIRFFAMHRRIRWVVFSLIYPLKNNFEIRIVVLAPPSPYM